jgi:cytochrome b6-f complex iron-sulfur subunit
MNAIVIAVLVALAALVLFTTLRNRDAGRLSGETRKKDRGDSPFLPESTPGPRGKDYERQATLEAATPGTAVAVATETAPVPHVPVDPEIIGVTRRQFFNRSIVAMMGLGISGFGAAVLAFLWPQLSGGFGNKINLGKVEDLLDEASATRQPVYRPEARVYINPYPKEALGKAEAAYPTAVLTGMEAGVVALYQKCPHLGCKVPFCATSQWFECGCHGSQYNRVGEKKGGPAPRGLDHFPVTIDGGSLVVDTGTTILGASIGVNTTGQEPEGPHCVTTGGH